MRSLILVAAVTLLAACHTPCPPAATSETIDTNFLCEDGSRLEVRFTSAPDSARIKQDGAPVLTLPGLPTGSGYRYAAEGAELRGRGDEVRWTRPGAGETICREAQ